MEARLQLPVLLCGALGHVLSAEPGLLHQEKRLPVHDRRNAGERRLLRLWRVCTAVTSNSASVPYAFARLVGPLQACLLPQVQLMIAKL